MKNVLLLAAGLLLAASLRAADPSKLLLRGDTYNAEAGRVTGSARATTGDLTVSADAIAFDASHNVLACEGVVTIRTGSHVITGRDCVITLPAGEKRVAYLSLGNVQLTSSPSVTVPPAPTDLIGRASEGAGALKAFRYRMDARPDAGANPTSAPAGILPPPAR